jgi:hypothetical protein
MEKAMTPNKNDGIRENVNVPSSGGAMQDFDGISAPYSLTATEEELCEYLVTKYQSQLPLTDDRKYEFQKDYRLLAETIRKNVVQRQSRFL